MAPLLLLHASPPRRVAAAAHPPPMPAAAAAPWRRLLADALRDNAAARHSQYFQLATVRPDGRPAARTVVFRGFLDAGAAPDAPTFVTDARSRKAAELAAAPWAEAVWYFTETREQLRLSGRVALVGGGAAEPAALAAARAAAWARMSPPGRQQFAWPAPGAPIAGGEAAAAALLDVPTPAADAAPLGSFLLAVLEVDAADHLDLRSNRRRAFARRPDGGWDEALVTP